MIEFIKNLLQGIVDFLTSAWDFVISIFEDTAFVVKTVTSFLAKIPSYFSWLPSGALALVVVIFGVAVVYKVLGRE